MICDSHCHISCHPQRETAQELIKHLNDLPYPYSFNVMTTNSWDLEYLEAMVDLDSTLIITPFLGVHPWYSHLYSVSISNREEHYRLVLTDISLDLLENLPDPIPLQDHLHRLRRFAAHLTKKNKKFGIGEIGLDKLFRIPSSGYFGNLNYKGQPVLTKSKVRIEHQMLIFRELLDLANQFNVPVSLHCVKAHGVLYDTLRDNYMEIPEIILHSYSGSLDQALRWINDFKKVKRRLSFSVSNFVNGKSEKLADLEALLNVLEDRQILVESDFPIDEYYLNCKGKDHQLAMKSIQKTVFKFKDWDFDFGMKVLQINSQDFLNFKVSMSMIS